MNAEEELWGQAPVWILSLLLLLLLHEVVRCQCSGVKRHNSGRS